MMLSIKDFNRPVEVRGPEAWRFENFMDGNMLPQVVAFEVFRKLQLWRYMRIHHTHGSRGLTGRHIQMNCRFPEEGWGARTSIEEMLREPEIRDVITITPPHGSRLKTCRIQVDTRNYRYRVAREWE